MPNVKIISEVYLSLKNHLGHKAGLQYQKRALTGGLEWVCADSVNPVLKWHGTHNYLANAF